MTKLFKILLFAVLFNLISCASKKNILFFQDIENYKEKDNSTKVSPTIKINDLLSINVSSADKISALPFNLPVVAVGASNAISGTQRLQDYLVNENGTIEFPVLGTINLAGLTKVKATEYLKQEISKYVKSPIINLRITNFKVSVLGEVAKPGTFVVDNERITILEALTLAGDMTIYGKRKKALLIRDNNGKKTYNEIDFTKSELLESPFYFLQQNDVLMVSPNKAQVQASAFNRNISVYVSIASIFTSVIFGIISISNR